MYIENDELACQCQQRYEDYYARLDNALMPGHDVAQRMIKLERDQQGHDLAEYGLEHPVLQRFQRTKYQRAHHRNGQPIQGDENDQSDDQGENESNRALESLIVG